MRTTETNAKKKTIAPTTSRLERSVNENTPANQPRRGISNVTAPRMKFVTVEVAVTRRLVPKDSETVVTKTDK